MASEKALFRTKLGMLAAMVGTSVGLGNIWRFPAVVQENGGGAFLLIYLCCVLLLGIPASIGKCIVGRAGRGDIYGSLVNLKAKRPWLIVPVIAIVACVIIEGYYLVVTGWTVEYFWYSITGDLFAANPAAGSNLFEGKMHEYIQTAAPPIIATVVALVITMSTIIGGVQKGIERASKIMMPALFLIVLIFFVVSLTLPGAMEGYKYFLMPDFSKVTATTFLSALGQTFFSLSLGFGALTTYASYYPKDANIGATSLRVALLDLSVAVMMGLIIFPAVMSFDMQGQSLQGTTLAFVTLPQVFVAMGNAQLWGTLFFALVALAAISTCISMAEVLVAFMNGRFGMGRLKACLIVSVPIIVISVLSSLSLGPWSDFTVGGRSFFDFMDYVSGNYFLPLAAGGMCFWLAWFAPKGLIKDELTNYGSLRAPYYPAVRFALRYIVPVLIFIIFITSILQ